ncbi:AMP-binding protein [Nocardia sp. R6R-6]|uniref:AMP-binding protein n=1 Tax=Nocardia sp. R6R-6 TaxID=3459303 RepID=UPI00403DF3F0
MTRVNREEPAGPAGPVWPVGAGTQFPLTTAVVGGHTYKVFDRAPHTLLDVLRESRGHGDRPALRFERAEWTFTEQWHAASALAGTLRGDLGVRPGDRIAIAMRNYPEWALAFWGAQLAGAVVVGFNAWFGTEELRFLYEDSRPTVVFADRERAESLATIVDGTTALVGVRCGDDVPETVSIEDLLARGGDPERFAAATVDPDAPATILYTSGTTGHPKGVISTHRNHVTNLLHLQLRGERPAGPSTTLNVYPMFHIAGLSLVYSAAFSGSCLTLLYKWNATQAHELIRRHGITSFSGPPLTVREILDLIHADPAPTPLRSLGSGGSLAPVSQVMEINGLLGGGVRPVTGYGLTETTSTVTTISGPEFVRRPTSIGRPLPTVEVRVTDSNGRDVPVGTAGELLVRGAQVARSYLDRPEETRAAFNGGWFRTGDLVRADDEGFLYIVGRLKDVVVRGGENISSGEVESVLSIHPAVAESAVIGVPHPRLGEEVCAVVRLNKGYTIGPDELRAFTAERLAAFKVPATIVLTTVPLPRNASGKLVKSQVKQLLTPSTP